jgi:hypothetical protein
MTRGLVRKNNLSDLTNPIQARINLGLQTQDYNRIRGLFLSSGLTNIDVQRIANSSSNFQNQINSSTARLATITPVLYADKAGDTLTGTWTNRGKIGASGIIANSVVLSGSTDALFVRSSPLSSLQIETASGVVMPSGLVVNNITSSGNVIIESGKTAFETLAIEFRGVPYRIDIA